MSKNRSREELQTLWLMLDMEFLKFKPTTDEDLADQTLGLILWKERLKNDLEKTAEDQDRSDAATLAALQSMDSDDPKLLVIEKTFKRLAGGRGADGIRLLKASVENKLREIRERQQKNARAPRFKNRHPLTSMVDPIVQKNPKINVHALFKELREVQRSNPDAPCAYDFGKAAFIPLDKKFKPVPMTRLSDFLYRAKDRIKRLSRLR